jgi:hypothetical protein
MVSVRKNGCGALGTLVLVFSFDDLMNVYHLGVK